MLNKIQNIEKEIKKLSNLKFNIKDRYYAEINSNIGKYYYELSDLVDTENNLKSSINYYNKSLVIFTKEKYSYDYAGVMVDLGNSYLKLSQILNGEKDIFTGISLYEEALIIFTKEKYSYDYGMVW